MQTVLLKSNSSSDLKLLTELAKKIGVSVRFLSDEEKEEFGLMQLIKEADRSQKVPREKVMKKLGKD